MKINIELSNEEEFFTRLPRFVALMNFSAKFAQFNSDGSVNPPDLPDVERNWYALKVHTNSTTSKTKEEVGALINEAYDEAEALGATQSAPKAEEPPKAEPKKEKPKAEPAKEKPKAEPKKEAPVIDIVTVRKVMRLLLNKGMRDDISVLLKARGADSISKVKEEEYPGLLEDLKAILRDVLSEDELKEALGDG